jgi:hypothetical protein
MFRIRLTLNKDVTPCSLVVQTFRRNILPPCSGSKSKTPKQAESRANIALSLGLFFDHEDKGKLFEISTRVYGVTPQEVALSTVLCVPPTLTRRRVPSCHTGPHRVGWGGVPGTASGMGRFAGNSPDVLFHFSKQTFMPLKYGARVTNSLPIMLSRLPETVKIPRPVASL